MILTDDLLLHYKRCQRRAFLDIYGNPQEKDQVQDFLLKLQQESRSFQKTCLKDLPCQQVVYPRKDLAQGFAATLEMMELGVQYITNGVLWGVHSAGIELVGYPDVLVRRDYQPDSYSDSSLNRLPNSQIDSPLTSLPDSLSDFSLTSLPDSALTSSFPSPPASSSRAWHYAPMNIKLGKRPKAEYQVVTSYHAHLLDQIQGVRPDRAWLLLRGRWRGEEQGVSPYLVDLPKWRPVTQEILDECIQILSQATAPDLFISRQRCSLCHWYKSCYAKAQTDNHLSLLAGVTPNRYQQLKNLGLTTKEAIAATEISRLEPVMGKATAITLIHQAQAIVTNQAILRRLPSQTFPTSAVELYFDIEAEPELHLDYLLGVLVVDKVAHTEKAYSFLAETPDQEELIWQQFLELVQRYPQAPIYHFSDYEPETVKRLARTYGIAEGTLGALRSRFIDVHTAVTETVILPVEGYSLKQIAKWLGFTWREAEITGADCVCLYDQWLLTSDRTLLDQVIRYNEDDCRATRCLKDWLEDFCQQSATTVNLRITEQYHKQS